MEPLPSLYLLAASLAFLHTILGPDHYLPFIAIGRSNGWRWRRLMGVTLLAGVPHVTSSMLIGFVGYGLGAGVLQLTELESSRGNLAGWLLVVFGALYLTWGIRRGLRHRAESHAHPHRAGTASAGIIAAIFLLGPCEPLIPLLILPAADHAVLHAFGVSGVFAVVTLATMCAAVTLGDRALERMSFRRLHPWSHALAGSVVLACGAAVTVGF